MERIITALFEKLNISASTEQIHDFLQWSATEAWDKYNTQKMNLQTLARNAVEGARIMIPNGTVNKPYPTVTITLPEAHACDYRWRGAEDSGIAIEAAPDSATTFYVKGAPLKAGDYEFILTYKCEGWVAGMPILEHRVPFTINADPRSIWNDTPTPTDIIYYKPDTETALVQAFGPDGVAQKCMVAASQRGRSHGHKGAPRDDHFLLDFNPQNGWYIMAVADGAGSAKYSRQGSKVACEKSMEYLQEKLADPKDFEDAILDYKCSGASADVHHTLLLKVYNHLANAAFRGHKAINAMAEAQQDGTRPKDYATTLLLAACKKFSFGWFIATFWVGDGALAIYNPAGASTILLGNPDEGEYSGQTRFLTMPEIFSDPHALSQRLRFMIVDDFDALMLMSDGVSDPMFGTDAALRDPAKWHDLWHTLKLGFPEDRIPGVDLRADNPLLEQQLLGWLQFWKAGEHDDRTIAILF